MVSYFDKTKPLVVKKFKQLLAPHFYYHSLDHTLEVVGAAESIALAEGIDASNIDLLKTAALFHDTGFFYTTFNHEEKSCEVALEHLLPLDINREDAELVCSIIMATKMPHNPKGILEEIMCDADLNYLGSDNYDFISQKLFEELNARGEIYSDAYWLQMQIAFLESHKYFTKTSCRLRNPQKQKQIALLKKQVS